MSIQEKILKAFPSALVVIEPYDDKIKYSIRTGKYEMMVTEIKGLSENGRVVYSVFDDDELILANDWDIDKIIQGFSNYISQP